MSGQIVGVKHRWRLGLIDLETEHSEADLLELAGRGHTGPNNWDLSAMAVAVAAARALKVQDEKLAEASAMLDELRDMIHGLVAVASAAGLHIDVARLADIGRGETEAAPQAPRPAGDMFDQVAQNLKSSAPLRVVETEIELDTDELQADYERRFSAARVLSNSGLGWADVVKYAFRPHRAPAELVADERKPTPAELRTIEKWLNQNAKRSPGDSL